MRRPALALLLLLAACQTSSLTGRSQYMVVSEQMAVSQSAAAYVQMMGELDKKKKIEAGTEREKKVREITDRLVAQAVRVRPDAKGWAWEVKVIDDPKTINAWCLPGGKVAFYTAILPVCKDENGIAVVMGHEVAHAYAQHGGRRMSEQGVANVGLQAVALALGGEGASDTAKLTVAALGVGYQVGVQLPFSRGDESAADYIGLMLMSEAGYDPRASVEFWKRMIEATGGAGTPEFLSTHPDPSNRIQRLEELMPKALEIYENSKAKGGAAQIP